MLYVRKKRDYFTKKGNKPMTKKRWKNKQFFFLLEIEKCKLGTYLNYVNTWNTNKLYAVLLTNGRF